jgi:hypothetical protein
VEADKETAVMEAVQEPLTKALQDE